MSLPTKKDTQDVVIKELDFDVVNGGIPADFYSSNPCLVGYGYIRFQVNGNIVPCCIAKHHIGDAYKQDWRDIWHSGAYENFRKKMAKIHLDRFHLNDPEWTFCQQCSHFEINSELNATLKIKRD